MPPPTRPWVRPARARRARPASRSRQTRVSRRRSLAGPPVLEGLQVGHRLDEGAHVRNTAPDRVLQAGAVASLEKADHELGLNPEQPGALSCAWLAERARRSTSDLGSP